MGSNKIGVSNYYSQNRLDNVEINLYAIHPLLYMIESSFYLNQASQNRVHTIAWASISLKVSCTHWKHWKLREVSSSNPKGHSLALRALSFIVVFSDVLLHKRTHIKGSGGNGPNPDSMNIMAWTTHVQLSKVPESALFFASTFAAFYGSRRLDRLN